MWAMNGGRGAVGWVWSGGRGAVGAERLGSGWYDCGAN